METKKDNPQGNASLAGAEFTWKYYAGFYNKDNLPAEATRTWVTKTIAETDSNGTTHYITKLADAYKVSGDSFYIQDGKAVLPLGTLTIEETKAPNGYLLEGALAEENIDAGWVIVNGNRIQIKRKQFEKIIDTLDEI